MLERRSHPLTWSPCMETRRGILEEGWHYQTESCIPKFRHDKQKNARMTFAVDKLVVFEDGTSATVAGCITVYMPTRWSSSGLNVLTTEHLYNLIGVVYNFITTDETYGWLFRTPALRVV